MVSETKEGREPDLGGTPNGDLRELLPNLQMFDIRSVQSEDEPLYLDTLVLAQQKSEAVSSALKGKIDFSMIEPREVMRFGNQVVDLKRLTPEQQSQLEGKGGRRQWCPRIIGAAQPDMEAIWAEFKK